MIRALQKLTFLKGPNKISVPSWLFVGYRTWTSSSTWSFYHHWPFFPDPSFPLFLPLFLSFIFLLRRGFSYVAQASLQLTVSSILLNAGATDTGPAHHCLCYWNRSQWAHMVVTSHISDAWEMLKNDYPLSSSLSSSNKVPSVYPGSASLKLSWVLSKGALLSFFQASLKSSHLPTGWSSMLLF